MCNSIDEMIIIEKPNNKILSLIEDFFDDDRLESELGISPYISSSRWSLGKRIIDCRLIRMSDQRILVSFYAIRKIFSKFGISLRKRVFEGGIYTTGYDGGIIYYKVDLTGNMNIKTVSSSWENKISKKAAWQKMKELPGETLDNSELCDETIERVFVDIMDMEKNGCITKNHIRCFFDVEGENPIIGSFVKIYCTDHKKEIADSFVEKYNQLCDEYNSHLLSVEDTDWRFEEMPGNISHDDVLILDDGIKVDIGYITMMVYGHSYPNPFDFECVEQTIRFILEKYGNLEYEGIVTIIDETSRYKSYDGTVWNKCIGNRKDYSYTQSVISEAVYNEISHGTFEGLVKPENLIRLWDDERYISKHKLGKLKKGLIQWYEYLAFERGFSGLGFDVEEHNSMTGDELSVGDYIVRTMLNTEYRHDEYKKFVERLCGEFQKIIMEKYPDLWDDMDWDECSRDIIWDEFLPRFDKCIKDLAEQKDRLIEYKNSKMINMSRWDEFVKKAKEYGIDI